LQNLTENNTVTDFTFTPDEERSFLLHLYHSTGGPWYWKNVKGWRGNSAEHHCNWFGIKCYKNSSYVKSIDLTGNGLDGPPPNLWRFRNMQGLCLSGNKGMTGQISDLISSNMTRLRRFCVSFTGMYGEIPWSLVLQLTNLEKLQICCMHTKLYGTFPHDIGRLNKLQVLSIGENDFRNFHLPLSIRKLTKLWFLDLEYAEIKSGELWYFNNMTELQFLHLTNCKLKGKLPEDFGLNHPNIIELRLYGNYLHGELHSCFLGFKKIMQLSLGSNLYLHGVLPTALSSLRTLQVLDLSGNNFTGFAENMTFSKQLQTLYLDQNVNLKVSGHVLLTALQPCRNTLRMLVAKGCGINGNLSGLLWNFGKILYIDLSENNITASIPSNFAYSMANLFSLTLASNNLTGELPKSFFAPLKSLTYLDLRGNEYLKSKASSFQDLMYLNATYTETLQRDTFTCPTLKLTLTGGRLDIDPDYYGYTLCFCNKGYYGFQNYCQPCMKGAACQVEASPAQTFKKELKMKIEKGYWPCCGNSANVTRMVKCSEQERFDDEICSPSGKCQCQLNLVNGELQTSCNTSCICRYGNKGRFCSQCIDGYYKKGSLCVSCPAFRKNFPVVLTVCFILCFLGSVALLIGFRYRKRLVLIVMFALGLALIVLHYKSIIPGWFFVIIFAVWILGLSGASENLESFLCIAVFFFQSLDAMFSDANIWPQTIVLLKYQITNAFNFEFSQLTCSVSDANRPEVSFAIILFLPVAGIFLIWLLHAFAKCICRGRNLRVPSSLCKRLSIQILLFVYFPITAKTFQAVLPCEHRDGLSYLKVTPWLDCDGSSYDWLRILGYVSLVAFVVSVPLFVFARLLYKYVDSDGEVVSAEAEIWLKPLYEEFRRPYRRYFPLVFLGRRLFLAVFLTLVPATSSYQVLGITLLLIAFISITLIFRPYEQYSQKFEFETLADVLVSVVLLLSFVGLALLRVSPKFDNSLIWLIISMNSAVVLSCVLGMLVLFVFHLCKSTGNVQPEHAIQDYEQIPDA
jgi:Leucine-rich repeat (LRR) protein